jgi:hypothetical protein
MIKPWNEPFNKFEELDIREAYSSLKVQYCDLKKAFRHHMKEIDILKRELEDYRTRYDHLIKYLNDKD